MDCNTNSNLTDHYITPLKKFIEIGIGLLLTSIRIVLTFDIKIYLFNLQSKKKMGYLGK